MIWFGRSAWYMKGTIGYKFGNLGVIRLKMGLNASLRSAFILETRVQGGINKNGEAKKWSRYVTEKDRKFSEGHIGYEVYQRPI